MTLLVKGKKHHHSVLFKRRAPASSGLVSSSSSSISSGGQFDRALHDDHENKKPEFTSEEPVENEEEAVEKRFYVYRPANTPITMSAKTARPMIPDLFTSFPPLRDPLDTQTSQVQDETIRECLRFLSGTQRVTCNDHGVPHLDRKRHIQFLHKSLKGLPAGYAAADASRPWMFYWALAGLSVMGEDISEYRERLISTVRPIQNATGGFGGGNGQMSHLAPTYAIILSLAMVGGREALDLIDRRAMWKWLGALKQPDGGFQMSVGGEEDVR
jgi:protein farnesyltransferase subunit beta